MMGVVIMLKPKNKDEKGSAETRAFSMPDLKANDDGNIIEGHAAVFDQKTSLWWHTETIMRGAFDNTDFKDVLFSTNHDLNKIPLARSRNNNANSTLQLKVDDVGLYTKAKLDLDNNVDAKSLYSAVSRGDMNGMSFIFVVGEDEWSDLDSDMPHRNIKSISKVMEVSAVSFPAYSGTDISARGEETMDIAKRSLDSARAKALENANELKRQEIIVELRKMIANKTNKKEHK